MLLLWRSMAMPLITLKSALAPTVTPVLVPAAGAARFAPGPGELPAGDGARAGQVEIVGRAIAHGGESELVLAGRYCSPPPPEMPVCAETLLKSWATVLRLSPSLSVIVAPPAKVMVPGANCDVMPRSPAETTLLSLPGSAHVELPGALRSLGAKARYC